MIVSTKGGFRTIKPAATRTLPLAKSIIRIFLSLLVFLSGCSIPTTDLPHPQPSSTVLLPGLFTVDAVVAQPFGAKEFHELFPLAGVTTSPKSFEPPPVFFDDEDYGDLQDLRVEQWVGAIRICQAGFLFCLPVFALAGVIHGAVETSIKKASTLRKREEREETINKWELCSQELTEELLEFNPMDELRLRLVDEMRKYGTTEKLELKAEDDPLVVAQEKGFRGLLQIEIREVGIQECGSFERLTHLFFPDLAKASTNTLRVGETFFVKMAIRIGLWDVVGKKSLYDTFFIYPDISESLQCRTIEAYCGKSGRKVVREELSRGIDIVSSINLVPQDAMK